MNTISLTAQPRTPGKGPARAARRAGNVPCTLYGRHVDAVAFSTSEKSLWPLIHTHQTHRVNITMGDTSWECILKDLDFHPVTDRPMHADFQVLQPGEMVTLAVPVRYVGSSRGKARGGSERYTVKQLTVTCLPRHIPAQIDVDVSDIDIGGTIHVRDLQVQDMTIQAHGDQILMSVKRPRTEIVVADDEAGEEQDEVS